MLSRLLRGFTNNQAKRVSLRSVERHSPLHKNIVNTKELRSEIFASRKRIPGRKVKYFLLASLFGYTMAHAKIREVKGFFQLRDKEHQRLQRRCLPFFQAMEDLRWLALDDRLSLVTDALFENKSKDWFNKVMSRFYFPENDFWANYTYRVGYQQGGAAKNVVPYTYQFGFRLCHGYEIPNI